MILGLPTEPISVKLFQAIILVSCCSMMVPLIIAMHSDYVHRPLFSILFKHLDLRKEVGVFFSETLADVKHFLTFLLPVITLYLFEGEARIEVPLLELPHLILELAKLLHCLVFKLHLLKVLSLP